MSPRVCTTELKFLQKFSKFDSPVAISILRELVTVLEQQVDIRRKYNRYTASPKSGPCGGFTS